MTGVRLVFFQVVHILNMTTAQVHSFQLTADENLHSLQKRIEAETKIDVANQELLQETGVSLDPRKPAAQCVLDGVVSSLLVHKSNVRSLPSFIHIKTLQSVILQRYINCQMNVSCVERLGQLHRLPVRQEHHYVLWALQCQAAL